MQTVRLVSLQVLKSCAMLLILLASPAALAHKPSDSYLSLQVTETAIQGQWDIALRDLDYALGLDDNQDGAITWGELRAHHTEIAAYALARLALSADGEACTTAVLEHLVDDHSDGAYAVLRFSASCKAEPTVLSAHYRLFFDVDPQHRGLLRLEHAGQTRTAIFSAATPVQRFELAESDRLRQFIDYTAHGVWHIWIGFDHLLFLLSLLLPAVLLRVDGGWTGAARFRDALWEVVKVVSAFTLAHSITLTLAALEVVQLPSRWVESAIAASVIVAALNNLIVMAGASRWLFAFAFGLIHGFGFASVLADLGLPQNALLLALVAFNLGVEVGQLAIVALFLPLAWSVRNQWIYRRGVLAGGSLLVIATAGIWLVERVFDLKLIA
ncbi:HupE/UreJ family protein [Accumulibacter sp.]|uniref:HupE/UreJ family protein n=1 Tax=Accumulibacter sp. TaxID=2053492 RepID=UPI0025831C6D|nr:HupE/UreJ family protein [Accumulibacter sp.]MCM8580394.1 HupE/UreJ family protein [Accumulibacter sp.]HMW56093.1 HupE/UreJ family protein [Accumulibacter sp.]HNC22044.1 HupE/UreJ family protein [Accumulibacter sp.]